MCAIYITKMIIKSDIYIKMHASVSVACEYDLPF